jgi:hypothetical protein
MTHRELSRLEWPRLIGVGAEIAPALPYLPTDTRIVVVEDAHGEIIGSWAGIRYMHCEGLWTADAHRKRGAVAGHLIAGMRTVARTWGTDVALTAAVSDDVRQLIERFGGTPLPGEHFVIPIGAR